MFCLAGIQPESCQEQLADLPVNLFERLDWAVDTAINLTKVK